MLRDIPQLNKDEKMRIGFVVKDLRVNGANRASIETAYQLNLLGHEASLFVESHKYPIWWREGKVRIQDATEVSSFDGDVLVSTFYKTTPHLDNTKAKLRVEWILSNFYSFGLQTKNHMHNIQYCLYHPRTVKIVCARYLQRVLLRNGIQSDVVGLGVDSSMFYPNHEWRDNARFRVLVEGNLRDYKLVNQAYESIPLSYSIWGLGPFDHGNRAERMFILPDQDDLRKIYSACSVYVKLPNNEGFPLAVIEALACGLPVICANEGGHLDFCVDGFNCMIVSDYKEVAGCLEFLKHNPEKITMMSRQAVMMANSFPWTRTAQGLVRIFERELKAQPSYKLI